MKVTKKDVQAMFRRLLKALGKGESGNSGDYWLDYNSIYGGYVVVEYGELGGESHPFGTQRRNAREMYLSLHMASYALEEINERAYKINKFERV